MRQRQTPEDFVISAPGVGTFTGSTNIDYRVIYTDSLNPINWQTLSTVVTDGNGIGAFTDPGPLPDERYYRITYP